MKRKIPWGKNRYFSLQCRVEINVSKMLVKLKNILFTNKICITHGRVQDGWVEHPRFDLYVRILVYFPRFFSNSEIFGSYTLKNLMNSKGMENAIVILFFFFNEIFFSQCNFFEKCKKVF